LQQEQFVVLTLGQLIDSLQNGKGLPQRCAVITVDDAYHSFLTDGWPLLKEYGYPATLFVSTDTVGGGDYLTWQDLKALQEEGVEIGNHSASHAYLLDKLPDESGPGWAARVSEDIRRSQLAFERHIGASPELFAYPYGEFAPELIALVKRAGFAAAFGQQSGVITAGLDIFQLPRFPMGAGFTSPDEFRNKLFMKSLPVEVVSPESPVIKGENPPKLKFYLNDASVDARTLSCFVPGQSDCLIRQVDEVSRLYEVEASRPLAGRRSKYTVTASDTRSKSWYWYSQLWVRPLRGEVPDHPVSR
jgi:hypothetical protein